VSVHQMAGAWHRAGLIDNPRFFRWYTRIIGAARRLQAGEYSFEPGMTIEEIVNKMLNGKTVQHKLTIIEGWTFKQLRDAIKTNLQLKHVTLSLSVKQLMAKLGDPAKKPEGLFLPETYFVTKGMTDIDLLREAHRALEAFLQNAWKSRSVGLPYKKPYDALIVASLLEKEASKPEERELIASVIINRLEKNMRLQIDPTVIYALGDKYTGKLRRRDLRVRSPYNTYRVRGLPPTPIAFPSRQSIDAALHPKATAYLYFVSNGEDGHIFSKTLKEQRKAIALLRLATHNQTLLQRLWSRVHYCKAHNSAKGHVPLTIRVWHKQENHYEHCRRINR